MIFMILLKYVGGRLVIKVINKFFVENRFVKIYV